jgi:hypothetical protein
MVRENRWDKFEFLSFLMLRRVRQRPQSPFSIGYLNVKAGVVKMFLYLWARTPKLDQLAGELSAVSAIFSWVFCRQVELRLRIKLWVFQFQ